MQNTYKIIFILICLIPLKTLSQQVNHNSDLFDIYSPIYNYVISNPASSLIYSSTIETKYDCFTKCSSLTACRLVWLMQNNCKLYSQVDFTNFIPSNNISLYEKRIEDYTSINAYLTNYWPFNNNLNDLITGKALSNGIGYSFSTDRLNSPSSALYFANGYLIAPEDSYFEGDFSVSAWVKLHSYASWSRLIDFAGPYSTADDVFLAVTGGTGGYPCSEIYNNGYSYGQRYSTVQLKLMKWQHLAMTLNGNSFNIYINGQSVLSSNANSPRKITRSRAYVGRSNWGDYYADYEVDDLKIFNRSLTSSEIMKVMNSYY